MHTIIKKAIKISLFWIAVVTVLPLIALYWLSRVTGSDASFSSFSQLLSLVPGKTGSYLRVAFYNFAMTKCGRNLYIAFLAVFSQSDTELGDGVYIGPGCNIGTCSIRGNTLLGSGVHIMSGKQQHNFSNTSIPIKDQGGRYTKVTIGEDCWIGNSALIMANLGDKCIVGAGSVVTNDIPAGSIVAGNPAKIIGQRDVEQGN